MKNVKIVMNKSRGTLFVMGLNEFYAKQIFAMVFASISDIFIIMRVFYLL